jgi:flagellar basal-body rod modification protein FlgD
MTVPSATSASAPVAPDNTAARIPQKTLGQNDFLKLITVQLTKQDPMKPMEDTAFIAQMAQFTSLEQTNNLVKQFGLMRSSSELASASSLIGTQVTVKQQDGSTVTGLVEAVDTTGATPRLVMGGGLYPFSQLQRVELPPLPVPAAS